MHWRRLRPCPSPCHPAYEIGRCEGRSIDKAGSSAWIHQTFPNLRNFAWQQGYGAFSVGISQVRSITSSSSSHIIGLEPFKKSWPSLKNTAHISTRNTSGISCSRSYRTLRDGSFEGRCPRHFVPGYDRCCPYGDCRTSAKNELFSCFWTIKTACPPFKNACTGILERRLFQNGQSPTAPVGTTPIVASHEVPGKASPRKNRSVGYGMIGRS